MLTNCASSHQTSDIRHQTYVLALFLAGALLLLSGCVERTISITSTPPGALVYLNDEEVGRTPLTVPFTFYGTYDVRLEAEGYQPLWTKAEAKEPFWDSMGPDLLAETTHAKSEIKWNFVMQKKGAEDPVGLVDRAEQMRGMMAEPGAGRSGATTRPSGSATRPARGSTGTPATQPGK